LDPVREVAELIKRHIANVLTYVRHRITNAVSEGLNCKIQTIKNISRQQFTSTVEDSTFTHAKV